MQPYCIYAGVEAVAKNADDCTRVSQAELRFPFNNFLKMEIIQLS